jgi:hypothetical protein
VYVHQSQFLQFSKLRSTAEQMPALAKINSLPDFRPPFEMESSFIQSKIF